MLWRTLSGHVARSTWKKIGAAGCQPQLNSQVVVNYVSKAFGPHNHLWISAYITWSTKYTQSALLCKGMLLGVKLACDSV